MEHYWDSHDWCNIGAYRTYVWRNHTKFKPAPRISGVAPCRTLPEIPQQARGTIGDYLKKRLSTCRKISIGAAELLFQMEMHEEYKDDLQTVIIPKDGVIKGLKEYASLPYYEARVSYYTHKKYGRPCIKFRTPKGTVLFSPGGWLDTPLTAAYNGAYGAKVFTLTKER